MGTRGMRKAGEAARAVLAVMAGVAVVTAAAHDNALGGVLKSDGAGALHVNSSDPLTQPVLLNGQDVLSVLKE